MSVGLYGCGLCLSSEGTAWDVSLFERAKAPLGRASVGAGENEAKFEAALTEIKRFECWFGLICWEFLNTWTQLGCYCLLHGLWLTSNKGWVFSIDDMNAHQCGSENVAFRLQPMIIS